MEKASDYLRTWNTSPAQKTTHLCLVNLLLHTAQYVNSERTIFNFWQVASSSFVWRRCCNIRHTPRYLYLLCKTKKFLRMCWCYLNTNLKLERLCEAASDLLLPAGCGGQVERSLNKWLQQLEFHIIWKNFQGLGTRKDNIIPFQRLATVNAKFLRQYHDLYTVNPPCNRRCGDGSVLMSKDPL